MHDCGTACCDDDAYWHPHPLLITGGRGPACFAHPELTTVTSRRRGDCCEGRWDGFLLACARIDLIYPCVFLFSLNS
ncbi:hypothetical protein B0H10DRAFT_1992651, partial [Mycena sp. CBHHK59/15]